MKPYLSTDYTNTPLSRVVQASWHDVVSEIDRVARVFREIGHSREAAQLEAYGGTLRQHAARHLDHIARSSNGHNKDSNATPVTELPGLGLAASEDAGVVENQQAPLDETGASEGGGHDQSESPPDSDDVAAATPLSGVVPKHFDLSLVERCELRLQQVAALKRLKPGNQQLEVALSFLSRARDLARRNHPTALARFEAAECVLKGDTGT